MPNPDEYMLNGYSYFRDFYSNSAPKNEPQQVQEWNQTFINKLVQIVKNNPFDLERPYGNQSCKYFF